MTQDVFIFRVGEAFGNIRRELGLTQEQALDRFRPGAHKGYLSHIETHAKNMTLRQAKDLADAYGVYLFDVIRNAELWEA